MINYASPQDAIPTIEIDDSYQEKHLPGDLAMWVFILMELSVFAIFFIAFAVAQRFNDEMFSLGRASLSWSIGLFCTLALVFSSYFVAIAVKAVQEGNNLQAKRMLIIALFSACFYLVLKLAEYAELAELGYGLSSNSFYTLYFLITGFHFMHVLLGMFILVYMGLQTRKSAYLPDDCAGFEAGASYWHMVDLIWIMMFFLIYIIH